MKKTAIFLAEGFEEIEAIGIVDVLRRAGIQVATVSITDDKNVSGAHCIPVLSDMTFDELNIEELDMLILPGGLTGTNNLNEHAKLKQKLADFANSRKYIAAICAAPTIFGGLYLLEGRKATCYPSLEPQLIGANVTDSGAVVDGNIITGKGPFFVFDFALTIVEVLEGKEKREEIEHQLLIK